IPHHPRPPLSPYTTLFRSGRVAKLVALPDADRELDQHGGDAAGDDHRAEAGDGEPDLQARVVEHPHPPRHAHQAEDVERHEGQRSEEHTLNSSHVKISYAV